MVRFCADVREKMNALGHHLDLQLGPGSSSLKIRMGLHSGPVTGMYKNQRVVEYSICIAFTYHLSTGFSVFLAGVLRGAKARFQLFGDTGELSQ